MTPSILYPPFETPGLNPIHHDGMFSDLEMQIAIRLETLRNNPHPSNEHFIGFYEHLLKHIDFKAYRAIQDRFLHPDNRQDVRAPTGSLKYIDALFWFDRGVRLSILMQLHLLPPLNIVELGSGPGHLARVAQYFGHTVLGSDLPNSFRPKDDPHIYQLLCDAFGVDRTPLRVKAHEKLPDFGDKKDLIMATGAAFNMRSDGTAWTIHDWRFFMQDVTNNQLTQDGRMFLALCHRKLPADVQVWLKSAADKALHKDASMFFSAENLRKFLNVEARPS